MPKAKCLQIFYYGPVGCCIFCAFLYIQTYYRPKADILMKKRMTKLMLSLCNYLLIVANDVTKRGKAADRTASCAVRR